MTASQKPKLDSEISLKAIVVFVIVLVLIVVVASAAMFYLTTGLRDRGKATDPPLPLLPEARAAHEPSGPLLQSDPLREMEELRADEETELSSYAWVDEAGGVAAIPVDRAMALLVESAGGEVEVETSVTPDGATPAADTADDETEDATHDEGGH